MTSRTSKKKKLSLASTYVATMSSAAASAAAPLLLPAQSHFRRRPLADVSANGYFDQLPVEIVLEIFRFLPLDAIGQLSLTSEAMRIHVLSWINSSMGVQRVASTTTDRGAEVERLNSILTVTKEKAFQSLWPPMKDHLAFAVLVKRLTCLLNTKERVHFAFQRFEQVLLASKSNAGPLPTSEDWNLTLDSIRFSAMINVFTRGWDESEYPVLLDAVDEKYDLGQKLRKFFASGRREDVCVGAEMQLRLTLRCLTWDFAGQDYGHRASWLLAIFKRYVGQNSGCCQAMIFYLLFGPTCQDSQSHYDNPVAITTFQRVIMNEVNNHADWEGFIDTAPDDFHEGKAMFYTLAQAICSCMTAETKWKEDLLTLVLDELFTIPSNWKRENVAGFLLFCSEKLITVYLTSKLDSLNDCKYVTVARLLVDMIIVSFRFDNDLSVDRGIGKIFDKICEYPEPVYYRPKLLKHIWTIIIKEVDQRELDMDAAELLEMLRSFGSHVAKRSYLFKEEQKIDGDVTVEEMEE